MKASAFRLANLLYRRCFPLYRPFYSAWKSLTEARERALLRRLVRPGMVIADVGANIGVYTRLLADLTGPAGVVYAFEPDPRNFARLEAACAGRPNVRAVRSAVGDRTGTIGLHVSDDLNVDHHTYDSGDGREVVSVPVVSLDDFVTPGQRVDLVKIDVQGFEYSVLRGATRVLSESPQVVMIMEFWPHGLRAAGVEPREVLDFLASRGFEVRDVEHPDRAGLDAGRLEATGVDDYCNLLVSRRGAS